MAALAAAVVIGVLTSPVFGAEVQTARAFCGPQTLLSFSTSADAAGTPEFGETIPGQDGVCNNMGAKNVNLIKFCGPGTLTLSRMTCNNHDYKSVNFEHPKTSWTTGCQSISVQGTNVDGYLGSWSVKC
eukprot:TRINITY_DN20409_c0_g1_i1.p1 TRINITY_DN20409_c0_g1~~TRINITY_DN20409_c0_g1_i1.p1  ORF type:complete len:129 (-),score=23.18 TRINITY_DN20409_c0_g1_i1:265-651(-)